MIQVTIIAYETDNCYLFMKQVTIIAYETGNYYCL